MTSNSSNDAEISAFIAARAAVDRSAWRRWVASQGIDPKNEVAVHGVRAEWQRAPLLHAPPLRSLSLRVISEARERRFNGNEPFPATLWMNGAEDTRGGRAFLGTLRDFAEKLLTERARHVNPPHDPKRGGWVVEPTTNPEGRRTNEKTEAMHALFLDCDGTGTPDRLLFVLGALEYAHIVYQSGGWTSTSPKWRVVIPLSQPFDVRGEALQQKWKTVYNHARVVFGCVAELLSVGFDPATETPCCPWFLTEKRSETDPERQIIWRPGYSLSLDKLQEALPVIPTEIHDEIYNRATVAPLSINEEKFEQIVDALSAATVHVPSGRRDIYLAMPATLLQRGICPDDVRRIVEEVSSRYPRLHPDKHADNLHNAETTITKWETEGPNARVTQIGTLQNLAPEVAAAFDEVLPDLGKKAMRDAVAECAGELPIPTIPPALSSPSTIEYLPTVQPVARMVKKRRIKLSPLQKKLSIVAKKLKKHKLVDRQIEGLLMLCVLQGLPLPVSTLEEVNTIVCKLARSIGYQLTDISWMEALELASPTLLAMDFTQSTERVKLAESSFWEGRASRNKTKMKAEKKKLAEQEKRACSARKTK